MTRFAPHGTAFDFERLVGAAVAVVPSMVPTVPVESAPVLTMVLLPTIPVMLPGHVRLYRMTRRPATEPTFFA